MNRNKTSNTPKLFLDELIDQLLAQVRSKNAESILGESGPAGQLKKRLAKRMLAAQLTHRLKSGSGQGKAATITTAPAQRQCSRSTAIVIAI